MRSLHLILLLSFSMLACTEKSKPLEKKERRASKKKLILEEKSVDVPIEKVREMINREIKTVLHCFKKQIKKQKTFKGCELIFTVDGFLGRVTKVICREPSGDLLELSRCLEKGASKWTFPTFQSRKDIHIPFRVGTP